MIYTYRLSTHRCTWHPRNLLLRSTQSGKLMYKRLSMAIDHLGMLMKILLVIHTNSNQLPAPIIIRSHWRSIVLIFFVMRKYYIAHTVHQRKLWPMFLSFIIVPSNKGSQVALSIFALQESNRNRVFHYFIYVTLSLIKYFCESKWS